MILLYSSSGRSDIPSAISVSPVGVSVIFSVIHGWWSNSNVWVCNKGIRLVIPCDDILWTGSYSKQQQTNSNRGASTIRASASDFKPFETLRKMDKNSPLHSAYGFSSVTISVVMSFPLNLTNSLLYPIPWDQKPKRQLSRCTQSRSCNIRVPWMLVFLSCQYYGRMPKAVQTAYVPTVDFLTDG